MARPRIILVALACLAQATLAYAQGSRVDAAVRARAHARDGFSRVIITTRSGADITPLVRQAGGRSGRRLPASNGQVALVPNVALAALSTDPQVLGIALDREVVGTMERTAAAVGANWVQESLGFDGSGVGVAIIDSGVANWHDDLGPDRVAHFADFVTSLPVAHDGYGHGTHVAGIVAGSGYDSGGARRGIAPGASLVVLKVLDAEGDGHISDVIAAIDYAVEQRHRFNIRVINLSVAAGVYESYRTDPLAVAAKRATDAGIVVVTAAGNHGRTSRGVPQFGGITSPGNAPWVLTVGASNHQRTAHRFDDTVAPFSSRGPTLIDRAVKPDLLAPGVAIESLADPGSTLYMRHANARIAGTIDTAMPPYLSMTGTSMASPVVAATVALMLEANPSLTPNLVKAILHYTAERRARVDVAAQGAGFLNARGAVQLASDLSASRETVPDPTPWSRQILWGNQRVRGGIITADASAWRPDVTWGAPATPEGDPVVWGRVADTDQSWGARGDDLSVDADAYDTDSAAALWPSDEPQDLVWGSGAPTAGGERRAWMPALPHDDRRRRESHDR